jgi:hypothetical protein
MTAAGPKRAGRLPTPADAQPEESDRATGPRAAASEDPVQSSEQIVLKQQASLAERRAAFRMPPAGRVVAARP